MLFGQVPKTHIDLCVHQINFSSTPDVQASLFLHHLNAQLDFLPGLASLGF